MAPSRMKEVTADLLAAKKALAEIHLEGAAAPVSRNWLPQMRLVELAQQTGSRLHAIGVGRKIVNGKLTATPCVRLYVAQKLPMRLLGARECLPDRIDGIPTDVVESPPAYFAVSSPCSTRKLREQRPAQGGISGANAMIQAGTLAARCRSKTPEDLNDHFVLGNCHSLADFGAAQLGSPILQPSVHDGGNELEHCLARLHRSVPIVEGVAGSNFVDAAIAKLETSESMAPGICTIGEISGTATATIGARVHKHGRTTGYTAGIIDDPSVDVLIPLQRDDSGRVAKFVDQVRLRPLPGQFVFAQPGDSGALVLDKKDNRAVALLFACPDNGSFAYANPIQAVLDALAIELE